MPVHLENWNLIYLAVLNFSYDSDDLLCAEYVQKYATEAALREQENLQSSSENESSLSDFSEDETQEMEL